MRLGSVQIQHRRHEAFADGSDWTRLLVYGGEPTLAIVQACTRSRLTLCRAAQPEMCNNVQQYDKKVYLRVSEAQRCRVHSTLVVPLYSSDMTGRPVAIFELVQSEKHCPFVTVMANLKRCLEVRPCTPPPMSHAAMHIDTFTLSMKRMLGRPLRAVLSYSTACRPYACSHSSSTHAN